MKLIQCRLFSGQRVPLLVQTGDAAPLPILVPFIYVQLKLRSRAYSTAAAHLRAIQAFYIYAQSRDLNIDDAILACHFEAILALLDGYAIWLQSGRQADNLVARIGKAETAPFPQIDPRTRDQYLRLLKQYLSWCVTRYIPRARLNSTTLANIESVFADVADVIERRFESHIINARPDRTRYRSLTGTQLQIIRTLIRPGDAENPYWRNTIYHLTGMSDVQQALALGRKRLDQNVYYQHTTIEENTAAHQEFLAFNNHHERIDFLHTGIRDKRIQGTLTDSYHSLLSDKGVITAEAFLTVHATALHVTPFGGCIHDFSQAPCPKHLQCWNGCSHLHLMGTPSERANIERQAENLTTAITIMRDAGAGEAGNDVWLADQEDKLNNLKTVLARDTNAGVQRVFPNGRPMTVADTDKRHSSVSDD